MKKQSTTIISIILLIIIVVFALLNTATVEVNFLFTKVKTPLVLLIFICLLVGALIIYLFSLSNNYKISKELKALRTQKNVKATAELKKQVAKLQKDNNNLRKQLQLHQAGSTNEAGNKRGER